MQFVTGFGALKPLAESIFEKPTSDNVNKFHELLCNTSPQALQQLQDFILVPLMKNVVDPEINIELKCLVLQCVYTFLENVSISSVESILRILSFMMSQIYDRNLPSMIQPVPEEFKLKVVGCALLLFENVSDDIRLQLYETKNIPIVSQAVLICVKLANLEMLQELRIKSMQVVMSLSLIQPAGSPNNFDPEECKTAAEAIKLMLPGITLNLLDIIKGPITQSSKVTATAVRTLGGVIALVMEDYDWGNAEPSVDSIMALVKSSSNKTSDEPIPPPLISKNTKEGGENPTLRYIEELKGRTNGWRSQSAEHLLPALFEIGKLQSHSHWRVRMEVVWAAAVIIVRCPRSLYRGLSPLLDALLHTKMDDQPEVRELCNQSISEIQDLFTARASKTFNELVEENMYSLLTRLPRLVQEGCGENTPMILSRLAGYIELLGKELTLMLHSAVHLQRFCLAIMQALVLDVSSVVLSPEYSVRELQPVHNGGLRAPWIRLHHCSDEESLRQVSRLVQALASSEAVDAFDIVGRQLIALMTAVPSITSEAALFLNELLKAARGGKYHHFALLALETYLQPDLYYVNIHGELTLLQSQKNVVRICIFTEGIACCIGAMKPDSNHPSLLHALYPVVERAGSSNYLIATSGLEALTLLASATGHGHNIVGLLNANMDYISHSLSTRLRRPAQNPAVFDALTLVLRYASEATLPGIRDIVNDVLLRSCDDHQETLAESHLRVFYTFTTCMSMWLRGDTETQSDDLEDEDENDSCIELKAEPENEQKWRSVDMLLEYHQNVMLAEHSEEGAEDFPREDRDSELLPSEQPHLIAQENQLVEREEEKEEEEKKPPPEVLLLESVLRRSIHFIPYPDINLQFLALRVITAGMRALAAYTDIVLPLGHQMWEPLMGRLRRDQAPLVLRTALVLLCSMAETCQDFLRPRIVKEIIPELSGVLESSLKKSHLQDKGSAFRFTQLYKLQKAILSRGGLLCVHLKLKGADFRPLLIAALPYLSCYQPRPLQKHCFNFVKILKTLDADFVWWTSATMWGTEKLNSALQLPPGRSDFCAETMLLLDQEINQKIT